MQAEIPHCQGWADRLNHCQWNCFINVMTKNHFMTYCSHSSWERGVGRADLLPVAGILGYKPTAQSFTEDIEVQSKIPATKRKRITAAWRHWQCYAYSKSSRPPPVHTVLFWAAFCSQFPKDLSVLLAEPGGIEQGNPSMGKVCEGTWVNPLIALLSLLSRRRLHPPCTGRTSGSVQLTSLPKSVQASMFRNVAVSKWYIHNPFLKKSSLASGRSQPIHCFKALLFIMCLAQIFMGCCCCLDGPRPHHNVSTAHKYILYLTPSLSFSFLLSLLAKSFCAITFGYQIKATTGAIQWTGIFLWQLLLMHPFSSAFPLLTLLPSQQHGMPAALNWETRGRCMQEEITETYRK